MRFVFYSHVKIDWYIIKMFLLFSYSVAAMDANPIRNLFEKHMLNKASLIPSKAVKAEQLNHHENRIQSEAFIQNPSNSENIDFIILDEDGYVVNNDGKRLHNSHNSNSHNSNYFIMDENDSEVNHDINERPQALESGNEFIIMDGNGCVLDVESAGIT